MTFDTFFTFETVDSTMDVAREKLLAGAAKSGTVVWADFQTGGRGRQGRGWFAPRGTNVCMTLIGERVAAHEAWQIALLAGVAVAQTVADQTKLPIKVRFPNDIYLNEKKLGGILVETVPHKKPGYVMPLIGIGVNVNVAEADFPPELRDRATSLLCKTGEEFGVGVPTGFIAAQVGSLWSDFHRGPLEKAILPRWRALVDPDARRTFRLDGAERRCRVVDIAGDGMVTLETEAGERRSIHAAQVILGDD